MIDNKHRLLPKSFIYSHSLTRLEPNIGMVFMHFLTVLHIGIISSRRFYHFYKSSMMNCEPGSYGLNAGVLSNYSTAGPPI